MSSTSPPAAASNRRWLALSRTAPAQFMVIMDTSIIGVALPKMQTGSRLRPGRPQLGVQRLRRCLRRTAASRRQTLRPVRRPPHLHSRLGNPGSRLLVAGLAGTAGVELAGRAVQGAGSAPHRPCRLTRSSYSSAVRPGELTKALALYGAAAPGGRHGGSVPGRRPHRVRQLAVGLLHQRPLAAVVLLLAPRLMPQGMTRRGSLDLAGAATVTAGLAAVSGGRPRTAGRVDLHVHAGLRSRRPGAARPVRRAPGERASRCAGSESSGAEPRRLQLRTVHARRRLDPDVLLRQPLPPAGHRLGAFASGAALLPMTVTIMVGMVAVAPELIARFGSWAHDRRRPRHAGRRPAL